MLLTKLQKLNTFLKELNIWLFQFNNEETDHFI